LTNNPNKGGQQSQKSKSEASQHSFFNSLQPPRCEVAEKRGAFAR